MSKREQQNTERTKLWSWILYGTLLVWRVVLCTSRGYIHPDEYFQSGQELWFGCPPFAPWEFESRNALRSIFPPFLMTKLPLYVWNGSLSGREVLVVPRVFCALLSIVSLDASVWILSFGKSRGVVPSSVLILASAWPVWVMLNRPFTNTLETMILALLLVACSTNIRAQGFVVGMLCAMGLFTRFTFVCFAFPMVLQYLMEQTTLGRKDSEERGTSMSAQFCQRLLRTVLPVGMGFCIVSMGVVYADFVFYQTNTTDDEKSVLSYVTPLNALLYNSKVDNLRSTLR